jgi:hypothetical protein
LIRARYSVLWTRSRNTIAGAIANLLPVLLLILFPMLSLVTLAVPSRLHLAVLSADSLGAPATADSFRGLPHPHHSNSPPSAPPSARPPAPLLLKKSLPLPHWPALRLTWCRYIYVYAFQGSVCTMRSALTTTSPLKKKKYFTASQSFLTGCPVIQHNAPAQKIDHWHHQIWPLHFLEHR